MLSLVLPVRRGSYVGLAAAVLLAMGCPLSAGAAPMTYTAGTGEGFAVAPDVGSPVTLDTTIAPATMAAILLFPVSTSLLVDGEHLPYLGELSRDQTSFHDDQSIQSGTLAQTLRSIISEYPVNAPQSAPSRSDAGGYHSASSSPGDDAAEPAGFVDMVLGSETAGTLLRSVVDVTSRDGRYTTFSVFGLGNFELDTVSGSHALVISELSNGWSEMLSPGRSVPDYVGYNVNALIGHDENARVAPGGITFVRHALAAAWDFLTGPLGIVIEMIAMVIFAICVAVRTLAMLQRRAPAPRRRRTRNLRRKSSTVTPPLHGKPRHRHRRRRRRRSQVGRSGFRESRQKGI